MKTLHIKNIERYHPKYKDRHLIWCKVYFSMIESDDEFEMLDEIDKWRFIVFVIMELKKKEPIILDEKYLSRKGFDFKKKSLSKTLEALSPFIEVCNKMLQNVTTNENPVTHNRIDYTKEEYIKEDYTKGKKPAVVVPDFISTELWIDYLDMRKAKKSPMTDKAQQLAFKQLERFKEAGQDVAKVIEQSIMRSYVGLFEVKNNGQQSGSKIDKYNLENIDYTKGTEKWTKR